MAPRNERSYPKHVTSGWLRFSEFLLLMLLGLLLYWLGHSMVAHHFFDGGGLNYRLSTGRR
jgi:hypothetical protein